MVAHIPLSANNSILECKTIAIKRDTNFAHNLATFSKFYKIGLLFHFRELVSVDENSEWVMHKLASNLRLYWPATLIGSKPGLRLRSPDCRSSWKIPASLPSAIRKIFSAFAPISLSVAVNLRSGGPCRTDIIIDKAEWPDIHQFSLSKLGTLYGNNWIMYMNFQSD